MNPIENNVSPDDHPFGNSPRGTVESDAAWSATAIVAAEPSDDPPSPLSFPVPTHVMLGSQSLRILVIEDEVAHCDLIHTCLQGPAGSTRSETDLVFAHSLKEARSLMVQSRFDCVLLDHNLPDGHGSEFLETMELELLSTPVIGISTSRDPEIALTDFRGGCIEYICKHDAFKAQALRDCIVSSLVKFHQRRTGIPVEQIDGFAAIAQTSIHASRLDPMTGTCNRSTYDDYHTEFHQRCALKNTGYGLYMVDIDHFNDYNDAYGHAAGDAALKAVARALAATMHENDCLARYGGEEFIALIAVDNELEAATVAERMRVCITDLQLPHSHNRPHHTVTVSIGVATFTPSTGEPPGGVFRRADQALFLAKAAGRNRVSVAPSMKKDRDS